MKENIEYDILRKNLGYDCDLLDEILDILVDTSTAAAVWRGHFR